MTVGSGTFVEGRTVDIVVPFYGPDSALRELLARLSRIDRELVASLTVVDNREDAVDGEHLGIRVLAAPRVQSSYYARNRGASVGAAEWILFLDADVRPPADLPRGYLDQLADERTGVLAGAVVDEPSGAGEARLAVAYAEARAHMSQANTLGGGRWSYAQTANCAVRRRAFEEVGGFVETIRSGGDADLCFRLAAKGWSIEPRSAASAVHLSRPTLRALLSQRARHGAGAAWLNRRHPGSFPRRRWIGLAAWAVRSEAAAAAALARGRRAQALIGAIEPLDVWAFELGRMASNEVRPGRGNRGLRSRFIAP
jgi:GT2 family glycosyltransferase